jgi:hypothetical protein
MPDGGCICYDPPNPQPVRPRDPRGAWDAVTRFLTTCTDWQVVEDADWTLQVFEPGEHFPPDWDHRPVVERARSLLGVGSRSVGISRMDGSSDTYRHRWDVPGTRFDEALSLLADVPPSPAGFVQAVSLSSSLFGLGLRDPVSGDELPSTGVPDGLRTSVDVHLSGASSVHLHLVLPFAEPDARFGTYLAAIRTLLPIARVANKEFRSYRPGKRAGTLIVRKVPAAILAESEIRFADGS